MPGRVCVPLRGPGIQYCLALREEEGSGIERWNSIVATRDGPMLTRVLCISGGRAGAMISARPAFTILTDFHSPCANPAKAYRRGGCCAAALWGGRASGKERFISGPVRSSRDGQVLNGRLDAAGSTECGSQRGAGRTHAPPDRSHSRWTIPIPRSLEAGH